MADWNQVQLLVGELRSLVANLPDLPIDQDSARTTQGRATSSKIREHVLSHLNKLIVSWEGTHSGIALLQGWKRRRWGDAYYRFSSHVLNDTDLAWTELEPRILAKDKEIVARIEQLRK